jgi:hypothetical protein
MIMVSSSKIKPEVLRIKNVLRIRFIFLTLVTLVREPRSFALEMLLKFCYVVPIVP